MGTASLRITYFLDVTSSWCWWAEPAWAALQDEFRGRVEFDWKIALMDPAGYPVSREQCDWFYRRSGVLTRSPYLLNSGWWEAGRGEYLPPNLVAEAAKDFGVSDDRVRLAIARAGLREGLRIGDWEVSVRAAVAGTGLDAGLLLERAQRPEVEARVRADTRTFHELKARQRPAFLLENSIGDTVVLSGLARMEPIRGMVVALLEDAEGYASFAAHFGSPPQ